LLLAGDYYLRMKHHDEAFELANRARDVRFHEGAYRILGLVYLQRGDLAKGVEHLEKAAPDAGVLDAWLRALIRLGRLQEVGPRLDQAERVEKSTAELKATCELVRALVQRRDELSRESPPPEGKQTAWVEALGYVVCAEQLLRDGKSETEVDRLANLAGRIKSDLGPVCALRARLDLDRGRLARALDQAEKAIRLTPSQPGGYYVRGRVRLERANAGALADLEKAAELSKQDDPDVLAALATALAQAGRLPEAVAAQRKAVKGRPADVQLAEQLDTLEKLLSQKKSTP
jgi:tetratricopeptide (TPR) repeat protein